MYNKERVMLGKNMQKKLQEFKMVHAYSKEHNLELLK